MLNITPTFFLDEKEIGITFIQASGPGGQNVNKVATAVQLRFDVLHSPSLAETVKQRLKKLAGKRMTQEGVLVIEAKRFRTQEQNRTDAEERLVSLIRKALEKPKHRIPTRPGSAAKARRMDSKKRRGETKRIRQSRGDFDI